MNTYLMKMNDVLCIDMTNIKPNIRSHIQKNYYLTKVHLLYNSYRCGKFCFLSFGNVEI